VYTISFDAPGGDDKARVGGKGANLSRLAAAGLPVPPGFCVTTEAYGDFLREGRIAAELAGAIEELVFDDAAKLTEQTDAIREMILSPVMPAPIVEAIREGYAAMGDSPYVAVRSSGTAEDLAEASFAGLHDTYLDIRGADDVIDAVRRCWASMWTARATAYRQQNGFDQKEATIAVVVQEMVDADVAGVLFTANPVSSATEETVINASWGLGEAVVSGLVTPDLFIVRNDTNEVRERTLGEKTQRIVRNRDGGSGTVCLDVEPVDRDRFCLSDTQIDLLVDLAGRVEQLYEGFPQDIEWALRDGRFYLLQARPITGVEFSWDCDLDAGCRCDHDGFDTVWTRAYAHVAASKPLSPLMYSARFVHNYSNQVYTDFARVFDLDEVKSTRLYKFHKAEIYYNLDWERTLVEKLGVPALRPWMLEWLPQSVRQEVLDAPFSWLDYGRRHLGAALFHRQKLWTGMIKKLDHGRTQRLEETAGLTYEQLRELSDTAVRRYTAHQLQLENEWVEDCTIAFLQCFRDLMSALAYMVTNWYSGDSIKTLGELLSGTPLGSDTLRENRDLWLLSEKLRASPALMQVLGSHSDGAFFEALNDSDEGRSWLAEYQSFLDSWGHRGAVERDIIYPRRCEDPSLDYQMLSVLLKADAQVDPAIRDKEVNERREKVYGEVLADIRNRPLGGLKVEAFKVLYDLCHRYVAARDDERCNPMERLVFSFKRGYVEQGRRLAERGQLQDADDIFFLSLEEIDDIFAGRVTSRRLMQAKIDARRRDWMRRYHDGFEPPEYLHYRQGVDLDAQAPEDGADDGVLRGAPMNHGTVTATARVIEHLADIGRVRAGEILVTHSTDPGWTPVFMLLSGVVIETGGLLSHAS
jgi:pyruvate,water dikinase